MCQGSQDMERKTEYSAQRNMPFYSNGFVQALLQCVAHHAALSLTVLL